MSIGTGWGPKPPSVPSLRTGTFEVTTSRHWSGRSELSQARGSSKDPPRQRESIQGPAWTHTALLPCPHLSHNQSDCLQQQHGAREIRGEHQRKASANASWDGRDYKRVILTPRFSLVDPRPNFHGKEACKNKENIFKPGIS